MRPDATTLNTWAASWSTLMVAVVWQSTILAAMIALAASFLRRVSPAVRYWLWQIVAAKLLLMPLWSLSLPLAWLPAVDSARRVERGAPSAVAEREPDAQAVSEATPAGPVLSSDSREFHGPVESEPLLRQISWTAWLMLGWGIIVGGEVVVLLGQRFRLGRFLDRARPGGPALESLVADCAARVGLARMPRVLVVDDECSPFVCGVARPVIVLPQSLGSLLPDNQLAPVLVHELAHLRRLDLLWNWIPQFARMLYFFHPIAHWVAFRVRLEGELACDGWAMAATGQPPGSYADLLVRVVGRLSEPAPSAGLAGRANLHEQC